ncbi:unnamed protein product, partial [Rotaria sp. Silwood2]
TTSTEDEEDGSRDRQQLVVNLFLNDYLPTHSGTEILENKSHDNFSDDQANEYEIYVEDFIDQMDANNNNRTISLYSGSPISVHDACVRLVKLTRLLHLDKKCGEVLTTSNEEKCSVTCVLNGQHRFYIDVAELTIMNIEYEIKRVAERYINLIN